MKTIYTIATIAMFAVILGMSAIAPAMAEKPDDNGKHKIKFCHYQEAKPAITNDDGSVTPEVLEDYLVIETDNKGKMNGHFKGQAQVAHHFPDENDDGVIDEGGQGDFIFEDVDVVGVNDSEADCIALHEEFNPDDD